MRAKLVLALIALLATGLPLAAQEDLPLTDIINYDDEVSDNLTGTAFWDWWQIQADAGDDMVIDMMAQDTLEPLLGILTADGELVARSEDGQPGGTVTLEYTVPTAGEYTIVATRVGNENGTSTGAYRLRVRRANAPDTRINPYQQVTFRCKDFEVTNVATLELAEDPGQAPFYLISVYGYGDFEPVIRVTLDGVNFEDCSRDSQGMAGTVFTVPGEEPVTIDGETPHAAQLLVTSAAQVQGMTVTIGSANGTTGRYVAVIDGLVIGEHDQDEVRIGQGPLASTEPLVVYMVGGQGSRLDPSMQLLDAQGQDTGTTCDDAGRRGCDSVPSPVGLSIQLADNGETIVADRFDAGVTLPPGPPQLRDLVLSSFRGNTTGRYALVLLGALPEKG